MQLIERTGGSAAYLQHLEEAQSATTEKAPQINKEQPGLIYSPVEITIEPAPFAPNHFVIRVITKSDSKLPGAPEYEGVGYSHAPGFKCTSFPGALTLQPPPDFDGLTKAKNVTFGWVTSSSPELMDWEVYVDKKAVMNFGGVAPRDPALVGKSGPMTWWALI